MIILANATLVRVEWLDLSFCLVGTLVLLARFGGRVGGAHPGRLAGGGAGALKDAQMVLDAG